MFPQISPVTTISSVNHTSVQSNAGSTCGKTELTPERATHKPFVPANGASRIPLPEICAGASNVSVSPCKVAGTEKRTPVADTGSSKR